MIDNFIANEGATYIKGFRVYLLFLFYSMRIADTITVIDYINIIKYKMHQYHNFRRRRWRSREHQSSFFKPDTLCNAPLSYLTIWYLCVQLLPNIAFFTTLFGVGSLNMSTMIHKLRICEKCQLINCMTSLWCLNRGTDCYSAFKIFCWSNICYSHGITVR